jgi:hypothetical protein
VYNEGQCAMVKNVTTTILHNFHLCHWWNHPNPLSTIAQLSNVDLQ